MVDRGYRPDIFQRLVWRPIGTVSRSGTIFRPQCYPDRGLRCSLVCLPSGRSRKLVSYIR